MTVPKLIRDQVPDLARRDGRTLRVRTASAEECRILSARKIREEALEFERNPSLEELADVVEAVRFALLTHGWTELELETERRRKLASHGGFSRALVLEPPV